MHFLSIILPFLNYAILYAFTRSSFRQTLSTTVKPSFSSRLRASLPSSQTAATALFTLDALLLTLASTAVSDPSLTCGLERRWRQFFMAKDEITIRAIQDTLMCCGFRTVKDQAWPFPAKGVSAGACTERFGRERACEGLWTAEGRAVLWMVVGVGAGITAMKVSKHKSDIRH